jgi:hypothetical protein
MRHYGDGLHVERNLSHLQHDALDRRICPPAKARGGRHLHPNVINWAAPGLIVAICSGGAENAGNDTQVETRRKMTRQMKRVGDLCLLAGSPQDAKRHYQTAISTSAPKLGDHVHLGSAHEGLASAILLHIASQDISSNILERYDQCGFLCTHNHAWRTFIRPTHAMMSVVSLIDKCLLAYLPHCHRCRGAIPQTQRMHRISVLHCISLITLSITAKLCKGLI